jgi:hypothetical protein
LPYGRVYLGLEEGRAEAEKEGTRLLRCRREDFEERLGVCERERECMVRCICVLGRMLQYETQFPRPPSVNLLCVILEHRPGSGRTTLTHQIGET